MSSATKLRLPSMIRALVYGLIVGLMLAGCGSMENHVRNHGVASASPLALQDRGDSIAVDMICACP